MKIYYNIPWNSDKNLGKAYNEFMKLLDKDDYAVFLDRDAMFCSTFYGKQIEYIVENHGADLYTCMTNRVNCKQQLSNVQWTENNMAYHIAHANYLADSEHRHEVEDITAIHPELSGVMMVVSKRGWEMVGGFREDKMLGIDNDYHVRIRSTGGQVWLMRGVYVYHWYRNGDCTNKKHLI